MEIGDASVGIAILVLAFTLPARLNFFCIRSRQVEDYKPSPSVLDWNYTLQNFQWNALLLLGNLITNQF